MTESFEQWKLLWLAEALRELNQRLLHLVKLFQQTDGGPDVEWQCEPSDPSRPLGVYDIYFDTGEDRTRRARSPCPQDAEFICAARKFVQDFAKTLPDHLLEELRGNES